MRVAFKAVGYEVGLHHYVEVNRAATKVVKERFPDAVHKGDIKPLAESADKYAAEVWQDVRALERRPAALVLGCGFPCRELSRVNQDRQGLDAGETARFHDANAVFQALVNERDNQDDYDLGYEDYWCSDSPCGEDIGGAESKVSECEVSAGAWQLEAAS